jgi:hypothetical protein
MALRGSQASGLFSCRTNLCVQLVILDYQAELAPITPPSYDRKLL